MIKTFSSLLIGASAALMAACGNGGDDAARPVSGRQGSPDAIHKLAAAPVAAELAAPNKATSRKPTRYSFSLLEPLSGAVGSYANDINRRGQIVGMTLVAKAVWQATQWKGTKAINLGVPKTSSHASAINDRGDIAGYVFDNGSQRATLWNQRGQVDLGTLGRDSAAGAINSAGQVVGVTRVVGSKLYLQATLWDGGEPIGLDTLAGPAWSGVDSYAQDINDAGKIVGYSYTSAGTYRAVLWNGTTPIDLGVAAGAVNSYAAAINSSGQVVGFSQFIGSGNDSLTATLWKRGTPIALDGLAGENNACAAADINNAEQIVGSCYVNDIELGHATLWNGTGATDLNRFLDAATVDAGWILAGVSGINDRGLIVGAAYNTLTQEWHAFLLTPFTDRGQCKRGGWRSFGFPNHGQCIDAAS